jgi:hypothetical protein
MRTFADTDTQARLIREMREMYEKRGRLEADIRAVDTARTLRIEKDALVDIAAYRALHLRPQPRSLILVPLVTTRPAAV